MFQNSVIFNKLKGLLGVLPAFLFIFIFFIGGAFYSFLVSVDTDYSYSIVPKEDKFWAYTELMNADFVHSMGVTTAIALIVSILAGGFGLLIGLFLAVKSQRWKWLNLVMQLPVGIPHLLAAYLLTQILWQTGFIARFFYQVGLIDSYESFPILIHDRWGVGVVLSYLWKEVPFIVLLIYPFLVRLLLQWKETGQILGANFSQLIRWVVIPQLLPIWVGGMWIVFAFVLAAYEIPALMARTSFGSIPVLAWQEYSQFGLDRQPVAISMNIALALISLIVGLVLIALQVKWYKQGRRLW